ncbi:MAG: hypothetical protein NT040_02070, partial [Bacteroidetes bacterium]|nr:hypothetical protein [Bacteroidota bacterium]
MRKLVYFLTVLVFFFSIFVKTANADIGVTVTNRTNTTPNLAASYTSLALALADLNLVTAMTGPVTLTLAAGSSETAPPTGLTIGSASLNPLLNPTNTITIVRASGTVTLNAGVGTATPASAAPDGILKIVGADYVTIDGLTFTDGNLTNPATMEFGFALFKRSATDGAQYNTIKNCTFNMQSVNNAAGASPMVDGSVGILLVNSIPTAAVTALTPTTAAGTNSFNLIYSNVLNGGNYGIVLSGYAAASPFTAGDTGNDIGGGYPINGNGIYNYGGAAAATNPAAGIRANNQWSVNISYNTINNNNGAGVNHPTTLRGIYAQAGTSANATITYNSVTVNGGALTSSVYGIDNGIGSTAAGNTIDISYNTITGSYSTATTGTFYGIENTATAATVNVTNNTIQNISTPGTGTIYCVYSNVAATALNMTYNTVGTITKTGIGIIYAFNVSSNPTVTCQNNSADGLSCTAAASTANIAGYYNGSTSAIENISSNIFRNFSSTGTSTLYGIYISSATGNKTLSNNQIYNFSKTDGGTIYGISMGYGSTDDLSNNQIHDFNMTAATIGTIYGIRVAAGTLNNIYLNKINALNITGSTTGTIYGLYVSTGTTNNVFRNKVCNIESGGSTPVVYGAYIVSGTTNNFYNNLIGDLRTPAANAAMPLAGIYLGGGTTDKVYDNTVYLNATSSGALFGSSALYASTSPTLDMRNNILVNTSTPAGATGFSSAYRRSGAVLTSYASTSNYNYFYTGTATANNVVYYDGTNAYTTLANFQAWVTPRDAASVTSDTGPSFVSTTCGDATFLHIIPTILSMIESGGSVIAGIDNDIDGDIRQGSAGYPVQVNGGGSAPDIGADEYDGIPNYTCAQPNPGNTLTTGNSICLGQGITLSLQNQTAGTGVSYQWQSSPDNGTYTNIPGANTAAYTTTPDASLWYRCIVTCQSGPVSGTSTPLQVTFVNSITGTTPGSRCGTGTVSLGAVASGGTLKWYPGASGGTSIGTGSPWTTPVISATTTYYVAAESPATGTILGAGASTSSGYESPFYHLYGGKKSQYLILGSELVAAGFSAGNINSLGFNVVAAGVSYNSFYISIGNTTLTALTTALQSGLTPVYSAASVIPAAGLNIYSFSSAFAWDGVSNIIVETCWSNNNTGGTSATVKYDATSFVSESYWRADSQTPATLCGTTTGYGTMSSRPQMYFNYTPVCSSARSSVVATVNTPPTLAITASQTVCNNTVATIEVTSTPLSDFDTYIWSPVTNLFTDIACQNAYDGVSSATILYAKSASAVVTTYTCTATKNSSGCVSTRQTTLTVLPASPAVSAFPASFCISGAAVLTLSPATGWGAATFQWQNSPDNSTFADIDGATTQNYTTKVITSTTYYKLLIKNSTGTICSAPQTTVTVNSPQVSNTVPGSRCGIGTVTLEATGAGGTLNWYAAPTGGASLGTGSPFVTPVINTTTTYYVGAESYAGGSAAVGAGASTSSTYSNPFYSLWSNIHTQHLVTAADLASAGIGPGNITSVALDVTSAGTLPMIDLSVKIAATTATSMSAFLSPAFTTVYTNASLMPGAGLNVLAFTTPFYWDGTSNIVLEFCHGNGSSTATMSRTVKSDPTAYVSSIKTHVSAATPAATICANVTTNLLTYSERPQFTFSGQVVCSSPRTAVVATVTPPPDLAISGNKTICSNTLDSLIITSPPDNFNIYTWSPVTNLYTDRACTNPYVALSSATKVYVKSAVGVITTYTCTGTQTSTGCVNMAQSTITVIPVAVITASPAAICITGGATLNLSPATGYGTATFQWQQSSNGIDFTNIDGATTMGYTTPSISITSYYKVVITNGNGMNCFSPQYTLEVSNPQTPVGTNGSRCGTGTVVLGATGSGGTLSWYASAIGGPVLGTGPSFTTPVISSTTSFYVNTRSPGATEDYVGMAASASGISGQGTGLYGLYFNALTAFTLKSVNVYPNATANNTPGTVTISVINGSGAILNQATVNVIGYVQSTTPTVETVNLDFNVLPGNGLRLVMTSFTGISGLMFQPDVGSPYAYPDTIPGVVSITSGTYGSTAYPNLYYYYYHWMVSVGCESSRTEVIATVTPPPPITVSVAPDLVCAGSSSQLSVTSGNAGYLYTWNPGNLSGAQQTVNPEVSTTYTVTADDGTCATTGTATITVALTPTPITITPAAPVVAPGAVQQLTVTGGDVNNVTLTSEDFNAPTNSWTTVNNSTAGTPANAAWTLRADGYVYGSTPVTFHSNDNSQFYMSNSDAQGSGSITNTELISPVINASGYSSLTLKFWHYFRYIDTDSQANIDVSTDGGASWIATPVASYSSTQGAAAAFVQATVDLTSYANQSNLKLRFRYHDSYGWYWCVDNVAITGTAQTSITWTPFTELYTDPSATPLYQYAGEALATVYTKPTTGRTYTAAATAPSTGCTRTQTVTVTVASAPPSVTGTVTNVTGCYGNSNGAILTSVTGGISPYSYSWSNTATTASLT